MILGNGRQLFGGFFQRQFFLLFLRHGLKYQAQR